MTTTTEVDTITTTFQETTTVKTGFARSGIQMQVNESIETQSLGEKIVSKFPSKNYGRLSILANFKLDISKKFNVSPNCFSPKPKVNSMVIHFKPKDVISHKIKKIDNLEKLLEYFFQIKEK